MISKKKKGQKERRTGEQKERVNLYVNKNKYDCMKHKYLMCGIKIKSS